MLAQTVNVGGDFLRHPQQGGAGRRPGAPGGGLYRGERCGALSDEGSAEAGVLGPCEPYLVALSRLSAGHGRGRLAAVSAVLFRRCSGWLLQRSAVGLGWKSPWARLTSKSCQPGPVGRLGRPGEVRRVASVAGSRGLRPAARRRFPTLTKDRSGGRRPVVADCLLNQQRLPSIRPFWSGQAVLCGNGKNFTPVLMPASPGSSGSFPRAGSRAPAPRTTSGRPRPCRQRTGWPWAA